MGATGCTFTLPPPSASLSPVTVDESLKLMDKKYPQTCMWVDLFGVWQG